jgi:hypothetical protein
MASITGVLYLDQNVLDSFTSKYSKSICNTHRCVKRLVLLYDHTAVLAPAAVLGRAFEITNCDGRDSGSSFEHGPMYMSRPDECAHNSEANSPGNQTKPIQVS